MSESKPYVRVVLTEDQQQSRLRSLTLGLAASGLLVVVLLVAATAWFDGVARWALIVAALLPLAVALFAIRGIRVLSGASRVGGPGTPG